MQTFYASAERAGQDELYSDIRIISKNPVVDGVMKTVGGLIAVLNEHRQIMALNETFLSFLGIDNPETVLGLRPGEAINCVHAHELPGGCGTSRYCSTCGAAIAIVVGLAGDIPEERTCVVTVDKNGIKTDLCLSVHAAPLSLQDRRFLLLFLQDITEHQLRSALERAFFHDISNIITAMEGTSLLFDFEDEHGMRELAKRMQHFTSHLTQEVRIQRALSQSASFKYEPERQKVSISRIVNELQELFINHRAAQSRKLVLPEPIPDLTFTTDASLIFRVVANMLINAFEATEKGGEVKMWVEQSGNTITFCVWNIGKISDDIARRIFQRHFSTKKEAGRGVGTYSMKLLGEELLGGTVDFTTSEQEGTVFRFSLPV